MPLNRASPAFDPCTCRLSGVVADGLTLVCSLLQSSCKWSKYACSTSNPCTCRLSGICLTQITAIFGYPPHFSLPVATLLDLANQSCL